MLCASDFSSRYSFTGEGASKFKLSAEANRTESGRRFIVLGNEASLSVRSPNGQSRQTSANLKSACGAKSERVGLSEISRLRRIIVPNSTCRLFPVADLRPFCWLAGGHFNQRLKLEQPVGHSMAQLQLPSRGSVGLTPKCREMRSKSSGSQVDGLLVEHTFTD